MSLDTNTLDDKQTALLTEAISSYRSTVFWNMEPKMTPAGYHSAIKALKRRGDLTAAHFAERMKQATNHAA